jgi:hypothetical protein
MRCFALLAILLAATPSIPVQRVDWQHIDFRVDDSSFDGADLSPVQQASIRTFILRSLSDDCSAYPGGAGAFTYSIAPVGRPNIVFVSPGGGCLRGGQGANASLWLVDTSGGRLRMIATPEQGFGGWGPAIQPHISHGLHDIVTRWHMSVSETRLTYLRFDGNLYRVISQSAKIPCETVPGHLHESAMCLKQAGTR